MPEKPAGQKERRHVSPSAGAGTAPRARTPGAAPRRYAEMHCKSNFSFLEGASHPEELVEQAAALGYAALAITDRNTLAGAVRMHCAAKAADLKLLIGAEIVPVDAPPVLLYATDRAAYGRLSRLITLGRRREEKGACAIRLEDVADLSEGLLAAAVAPPGDPSTPGAAPYVSSLMTYRDIFADRLSLAASVHGGPDDARRLAALGALSRGVGVPLLATNDVHYHEPARRFLQDVLTCVRLGCTIEEAGRALFANAERHLKPAEEMERLFAEYPAAIARTLEIADRCRFRLDELRYEYPLTLCPTDKTQAELLAELTWAGARERYPRGVPPKVRDLLEHELRLIGKLEYEPYFLTVWDIVTFARSRGILCQGRGSAANSAVCYCLGITSVDPDRIEVLFERFVSAERNEPPDIDVDFEHERREEVFQYIYDKYGREHAGIVAEVISYRPRSAIRDVGKALGLSLDRVTALARQHEWWDKDGLREDAFRASGLDPHDRTVRLMMRLVSQLLGFPRHLSQHVGGFAITRGPLCEIVPIENAAMPDRTFIEWDKDDIDALGILKIDCLALGMLTAIHKCFEMVNEQDSPAAKATKGGRKDCGMPEEMRNAECGMRNGEEVSAPLALHTIPAEDPHVYEMVCHADTVGVFQIESRAQMSMLPRLRPRCFYDLVIEVAIVRPGPIQGGMVHPYLRRRNGEEEVTFPSEAVRSVLQRTLGVPLFQEQAMRLAIVAAGFTPGEADQLRRAMAAWRRAGEIERFRTRLVAGMTANGLPLEFAERCFQQICGFGEYGFPESHAVSFALLVYISAWLKRYHPAAFCASLLNSQPMGFYQPAQLVRDAREHGVTVLPVDINHSDYDCTLEDVDGGELRAEGSRGVDDPAHFGAGGPAVRLGMRLIRGVSAAQVEGITRVRRERPFTSLYDLVRRSGAARATLARLAAADALASLDLDRRRALWDILALEDEELPLFAAVEPVEPVPRLPRTSMMQRVTADYASVGLSLRTHPVALVRGELDRLGAQPARVLRTAPQGRRLRVAGLVLVRQRPPTAKGILFCTLEDESGIANLIVRPEVFERYRREACTAVMLLAHGRVERQGEVVHLHVQRLTDLSHALREVSNQSRDFH